MNYALFSQAGGGLSLARELCFPLGCALCGAPLLKPHEAQRGLCSPCAALFEFEPTEERCERCGKPLISEIKICIPCRTMTEAPAFDRALLLYPYTGKWRELLGAYKFGSHRPLARFLAEKLIQGARAFWGNALDGWEWTPVPARAGKIKEKGWDQIKTIARILKSVHRLPVRQTLKRLQSNSQKELDREKRLTNLQGRIVPLSAASRNVILFDDVYTTGSTLNACAAALKSAGAEHVYGLCLFYGQ